MLGQLRLLGVRRKNLVYGRRTYIITKRCVAEWVVGISLLAFAGIGVTRFLHGQLCQLVVLVGGPRL